MGSKKDFTAAAADIFVKRMATPVETPQEREPQPQKPTPTAEPVQETEQPRKRGRKPNPNRDSEERVTLIVDSTAVEKLRAIAWQSKRKFKEVVLEAVQTYLTQYEAEHGEVKTR